MAKSKDLFDESTMSFGEHLEVLRTHLWKALLGTAVCVVFGLFIGGNVVNIVRGPIDRALSKYGAKLTSDNLDQFDMATQIKALIGNEEAKQTLADQKAAREKAIEDERKAREDATIKLEFKVADLIAPLHEADPEKYPLPKDAADKTMTLDVKSDQLKRIVGTLFDVEQNQHKPVTLEVQEAFMTYLKVAFITGFALSSPWIFYQLWQFIAAGLYSHERKYVYIYLPFSLFLFIGGALFCFYGVFPFILNFLLAYNAEYGLQPQIRLSDWVSFALMLPLMFGISFQLPLVMMFLERINVFSTAIYRDKRRFAILVIAFLSMVLTPAEPVSMMMMMFPMLALYELGILLCEYRVQKHPFGVEAEG